MINLFILMLMMFAAGINLANGMMGWFYADIVLAVINLLIVMAYINYYAR